MTLLRMSVESWSMVQILFELTVCMSGLYTIVSRKISGSTMDGLRCVFFVKLHEQEVDIALDALRIH